MRCVWRSTGDRASTPTCPQLIWSVPEIIANLSRYYRLMPGDLIYTGTPDGVGPLQPGDRIEASVEGVGSLRAEVAASPGPR